MGTAARADYFKDTQHLRNVRDVNITDRSDESTEIPSVSGDGSPDGWTHPPKRGKNVSFTTTWKEQTGPEVDWPALKEAKTEFDFQRVTTFKTLLLERTIVQTVEEQPGDNEEVTLAVTLSSLYSRTI